jgi:hypothetical protein
MGGPSLQLQPSCPCCGQGLRRGWRIEQKWGRFIQFAGPGNITPMGIVPLDAPPAMVRDAAALAGWATPPEAIAAAVWNAANTLVHAGWPQVVAGTRHGPGAAAVGPFSADEVTRVLGKGKARTATFVIASLLPLGCAAKAQEVDAATSGGTGPVGDAAHAPAPDGTDARGRKGISSEGGTDVIGGDAMDADAPGLSVSDARAAHDGSTSACDSSSCPAPRDSPSIACCTLAGRCGRWTYVPTFSSKLTYLACVDLCDSPDAEASCVDAGVDGGSGL